MGLVTINGTPYMLDSIKSPDDAGDPFVGTEIPIEKWKDCENLDALLKAPAVDWHGAALSEAVREANPEAKRCATFESIALAIQAGHVVAIGLDMGSRALAPYTLDGTIYGVIEPGGIPIGRQVLMAYGLVRHVSAGVPEWLLFVDAGLGDDYGSEGFILIPQSYFPAGTPADAFTISN